MEDLIASNGSRFLFAVTIVGLALGALVGVLWLLKHRGTAPSLLRGARPRDQRLAVIESTAVDARRRLVLVRRDDVEHLLLIGGPADLVLESRPAGVLAAAPAASDAPAREPTPAAAPAGAATGVGGTLAPAEPAAGARLSGTIMAANRPVAPSGRDDGRDLPQAVTETGDRAGGPSEDRQRAWQKPVQESAVHPSVPHAVAPPATPSAHGSDVAASAAPSSRPLMPAAMDRPRAAPVTDPLDVLFPPDERDDEASAAAALARRFDQFADDDDEASVPENPALTPAAARAAGFAKPSAGWQDPAIDPLDALFPPAAAQAGVTAETQAVPSPTTQAPEQNAGAEPPEPALWERAALAPAPVARTAPVQAGRASAPPVSDPLDMLFPEELATAGPDEAADAMDDEDAAQRQHGLPHAPDEAEIATPMPAAPEPEAALVEGAPSAPMPAVPAPRAAAAAPATRQRPITRKGTEPAAWRARGGADERQAAQAPSDMPSTPRRTAPIPPAMAEPDARPATPASETMMRAAERTADEPQRSTAALRATALMEPEPTPAPQPVRAQPSAADPLGTRPPAVKPSAIRPAIPEPPVSTPPVSAPLATRPGADETPAMPGTAAAEFAQKLANERRMPFEQRLARAAAQRAADTTRPAAPPVSAMGQVLYRDGEEDAPVPTAPGRLPPQPEQPPRADATRSRATAAEPAKAATVNGGDRRSAADLLDAARERVLAASRPQPSRAEAQPAKEQPLRATTPAAQPGSFESILAAGGEGTAAPVTAGPVLAAQRADRRTVDAHAPAAPSADSEATASRAPSARPAPPRAAAGQLMPRATPTAPPKSS